VAITATLGAGRRAPPSIPNATINPTPVHLWYESCSVKGRARSGERCAFRPAWSSATHARTFSRRISTGSAPLKLSQCTSQWISIWLFRCGFFDVALMSVLFTSHVVIELSGLNLGVGNSKMSFYTPRCHPQQVTKIHIRLSRTDPAVSLIQRLPGTKPSVEMFVTSRRWTQTPTNLSATRVKYQDDGLIHPRQRQFVPYSVRWFCWWRFGSLFFVWAGASPFFTGRLAMFFLYFSFNNSTC